MTQAELDKILAKHTKWLNNEDGGECADLRGADLRSANLRSANLQDANLRYAYLRDANLQGASIDVCSWPIWCGSLKVHIDDEIGLQLLYHAVSPILYSKNTSKWLKRVVSGLVSVVNMFIKVKTGEVDELEPFKE